MPSTELCSETEVAELVTTFYAKVRVDPLLAPIFERHVADWSLHMPKMVAFWSTALCGSKRYRGNPMLLHRALPDLTPAIFGRWLELFRAAASELPNRTMAERADELAQRIAQSFWYDYQLKRAPDRMPTSLPHRPAAPQSAPALE